VRGRTLAAVGCQQAQLNKPARGTGGGEAPGGAATAASCRVGSLQQQACVLVHPLRPVLFCAMAARKGAGSRVFSPAHPTSVTRHSILLPASAHCTPTAAQSRAKSAGSPRMCRLAFWASLLRPCALVKALLWLWEADESSDQPAKREKEARPASCVSRKKLAAN
jgi:hypothetical protein